MGCMCKILFWTLPALYLDFRQVLLLSELHYLQENLVHTLQQTYWKVDRDIFMVSFPKCWIFSGRFGFSGRYLPWLKIATLSASARSSLPLEFLPCILDLVLQLYSVTSYSLQLQPRSLTRWVSHSTQVIKPGELTAATDEKGWPHKIFASFFCVLSTDCSMAAPKRARSGTGQKNSEWITNYFPL